MDIIGSIKEFNRHKDDWFLYRERLEQYFDANEINDIKRRASILLILLDKETYEILHNFCYPDLIRSKTYIQLCKLLEHQFGQKISVLRERIRFYSLRQNPEENIADWQIRIKKASKKCQFEKILNTILVDKFLTGLNNSKIIERICEEEFSTSRHLNDWIISVLQFECELKNISPQNEAVTSESLNFQRTIKEQKNYNVDSKINNGNHQNVVVHRPVPHIATLKAEKPYVRITEQPKSTIRFRYVCEGRMAGSIVGVSSTAIKKTFPTIEVVGFRGKAIAIVSCVTTESPYRPHPHQLTGKIGCRKGVCVLDIPTDTMSLEFSSLGIQCTKRNDIEASMKMREEIRIDPYNTGFYYKVENFTLNSVRLCIQVFLENGGNRRIPLCPIITNPIYDKKMLSELVIIKMSHCIATVDGGRNEIVLLCDKIIKDDIKIRFYEEVERQVVWESFGIFKEDDVHKNVALSFRVPKYKDLDITEAVTVYVQLKRPSDGETSEPLPFQYYPIRSELEVVKRKRHNFENDSSKRECMPKPDVEQQMRGQIQTNLSYNPVPIDEVKEDVKGPMQPAYYTPLPYIPPSWNSNFYLQQQQYGLTNLPTQSMQQQMPGSTVSCYNNPQHYNIPLNFNNNPFLVNNELEASWKHNINNIESSFHNYLDVHQANDLNKSSLTESIDLTQLMNMEQLSDQFLTSLSLEDIPQQ